jgi:hypothetical protein
MHSDHVGDLKLKAPGEGACANSTRVPVPNSTTAEVVAAKNAALVTTRGMAGFVHNKVQAIRGGGKRWTSAPICPSPFQSRRRAAHASTWAVFSPRNPRALLRPWRLRSSTPRT